MGQPASTGGRGCAPEGGSVITGGTGVVAGTLVGAGGLVAARGAVAAGGSVSTGRVSGGVKEQERMKTSESSGMSRRFIILRGGNHSALADGRPLGQSRTPLLKWVHAPSSQPLPTPRVYHQ